MTRDDIIRMGSEADLFIYNLDDPTLIVWLIPTEEKFLKFATLVAAAEREACAKVCEEKQTYSMPIPCPDGIEGCCVAHVVPARREKTGSECASAIRARGEA